MSEPHGFDGNLFRLLMIRAEVAWRAYETRHNIEWRVNFSLWTGLGILAGFLLQAEASWPCWVKVTLTVILLTGCWPYFLWKVEIQQRNKDDLDAARELWRRADRALGLTPIEQSGHDRRGHSGKPYDFTQHRLRPTHLSQLLITVLFVVIALLATWAPKS
jgi:hypothetical protein